VRVLYLIDSLAAGGAERSLAALAPHYRRLGIHLDVAYLHERPGVGPELQTAGATLFPLGGARGMPGALPRVVKLIRNRRPDLVHTTLFEADIVGRVASAVTRATVVGSLVNTAYGPEQLANPALKVSKVRFAQMLDAVTARRVARFHAVSNTVAEVMAKRLRLPRERIDVVPRGRDPAELGTRSAARRAAARAMLGATDADRIVLAVGRHEYQKGFDVLVRAFARVRAGDSHARLLIAGREGAATPALRSLLDATGADGVELLGTRTDVAELLCAADVFAFASRWEGLPGGVLEAMALEVPIVATDIAPVREVVGTTGCTRLVPPDDAEALAAALASVLRDPRAGATAASLAAGRERFLEHFTTERVADEMLRFYTRATEQAQQPRSG
jgi:glycosyltransferase involved in cell wall biosynthesis